MSLVAVNKTLEDAEWDAQKSIIQELYISEDKTLDALIQIMSGSHHFRARYHIFWKPLKWTIADFNSKSQYERHLKRWKMRKNLKNHEWKAVHHHTSKRKIDGKESDLYVDGILIPNKKVRKETSRNSFTSTFDRITQGSPSPTRLYISCQVFEPLLAPSPKIPDGLVICTPPASGLETLPVNTLPWFQFAAFLDTAGEIKYANSHVPSVLQRTLCQSGQSTTSNKLDIRSLDITATGDLSQGLVPGASIQSSLNEFQDRRFNMIPAFLYTRGERSTNNLPPAVLKMLSVLPENTQNNLGRTTQSFAMQIIKLLMFLLSNNHDKHDIKDSIDVDETILRMMRAHNGQQYKHLLSHSGPTSEALLEKIFQTALRAQDVEVIRIALAYGIDPTKQRIAFGYKTITPLQFTSHQGNLEIASMLLNAGADVSGSLFYAVYSAVYSSYPKNPEMVSLLLAKGAHANTEDGDSALYCGLAKGDVLSARILISAGADVTSVYKGGHTTLHLAREDEMVKILLQAGADVNAVTCYGTTVLELVVQYGSTNTIQSLLDADLEVFGSAVYFAVDRGDIEILQILLTAGADIDACFKNSRRTALTRAVENENVSLVKFLLESGADVNGCTLEQDSECSDLLESKGWTYDDCAYSIDWEDWKNYTPLQAASFHQDIEIARTLIEAGANVNMDFAAGTLYEPERFMEDILEDKEKEVEDQVFYGTALQIAAHQGNMVLIWLFCHAGANVNAPAYRLRGRTALQAAVENGDHRVIEFLLAAGADVNAAAAEKDGTTVLAAAIMRQDPHLSNSILKEGANLKDKSAGRSGVTALAAATANRDVRLVRILLLAGANPLDSAALQAAVANDDTELTRILLAAQANSDDHGEMYYGYLALYRAVLDERHELVEILLASKIDPSVHVPDATGFVMYLPVTRQWINDVHYHISSSWHVALMSKSLRLVQIFLEAGADPNQIFEERESIGGVQNCLLVATLEENIPLMQMLLEAGADVNVDLGPNYDGTSTPLSYAARRGQTDSVRLLLKAGASTNTPGKGTFRRTALQAAAEYGHEDVVDILLEAGADVNAPPSSCRGVTALQAAAIGGFLRMARVLVEAGADVNAAAAEEKGRTALAGAAEHGRIDMLQYLLNNGANIDGPGQAQYESAIHEAAENGHLSACNLLNSHHRRLYGSS